MAGDRLPPMEGNIVPSAAACDAGVVRRYFREDDSTDESDLEASIKGRMGRILYLFGQRGMQNRVLGSFGTVVFRRDLEGAVGQCGRAVSWFVRPCPFCDLG